jgi:2-methylcitrate dehydratase PrpD
MSIPEATRQLAKFAADLKHDDVPPKTRARAIDLLVDQIGVQIGGSDLPWSVQVRDTLRKAHSGPSEATVARYGDRLPVSAAAFVNSAFGHSFEFDDANPLIHGHPGSELVPSLVAVSERDHISGRDFLTTFIAAYEVRGHIGWAASASMASHLGPQFSSAYGPFGVAAGVARLFGLSADGIRNAMGIAGTYSGGLMQYNRGGGSVKRIFSAVAASSGIQSAQLAQAGITGPEQILEGERGVLRLYAPEYHPEFLVAELGSKWTIDSVSFKPYCCSAVIHPAIEALKKVLTEHAVKASEIEAIEVGYPARSIGSAAIAVPADLLGMQFSTAFSLALTATAGSNTPREYTMAALNDPEVRAVAARVSLHEDDELSKASRGRFVARVKVKTRSGGTHEALVSDAKGTPGAPLSSSEIDAKFSSQVADVLGKDQCAALLKALRDIDRCDDIAELSTMLVKSN